MKYLIINADDFGMSQCANEAIEALFEDGCITSTTLMTPCPWAEDALERAMNNKKMNVGLHTTLNAEWAWYRWGPICRKPVPSLLDRSGYFYNNIQELLAVCTDEDVTAELDAQLDFMLSRGYRPTHIDNHMGSVYGLAGRPLYDSIFKLCTKDANTAKDVYPFRLPRNISNLAMAGGVPPKLADMMKQVIAQGDALGIGTLDYLCANSKRYVESDGYDALKRDYLAIIAGFAHLGDLGNLENVGALNDSTDTQDKVVELYLHPAMDSKELRRMSPTWFTRVWEYKLLQDPDFKDAITAADAVLTTWPEAPLKGRAIGV